jgi:hypothetical protein
VGQLLGDKEAAIGNVVTFQSDNLPNSVTQLVGAPESVNVMGTSTDGISVYSLHIILKCLHCTDGQGFVLSDRILPHDRQLICQMFFCQGAGFPGTIP